MTTDRVQDFYTQRAKLYKFFFIDVLKWENVLATFFGENSYLRSDMKILDAGCGTGAITRALYGLARQQKLEKVTFHAFDLTPAMLEIFRQWVEAEQASDITLQHADVLELEKQLPQNWNGYDLIISSAMVEYIPKDNIPQALTNLRLRLNENGSLLVLATKKTWISQLLGGKWWGTNTFEPGELKAKFQEAGLQTIQFKSLPSFWRSSILVVEAKR